MDSFMCLLATTFTVLLLGAGGVGGNPDCATGVQNCFAEAGMTEKTLSEGVTGTGVCGPIQTFLPCFENMKTDCPNFVEQNKLQFTNIANQMTALQQYCAVGPAPCLMKFDRCFTSSGVNLESPPSMEYIKNNTDGICGKLKVLQPCIKEFMPDCGQPTFEQMANDITRFSESCAEYGIEDVTGEPTSEPEDENPSDSATSAQFSPLLLLVIPVFMQAWVLV